MFIFVVYLYQFFCQENYFFFIKNKVTHTPYKLKTIMYSFFCEEAKRVSKRLQEEVLRAFWKQKWFEKRFFANLMQKIDFAKKHAKPKQKLRL